MVAVCDLTFPNRETLADGTEARVGSLAAPWMLSKFTRWDF